MVRGDISITDSIDREGTAETAAVCALYTLATGLDGEALITRTEAKPGLVDSDAVLMRSCAIEGCKAWFPMRRRVDTADWSSQADTKQLVVPDCVKLPSGIIRS